MEHRSELGAHSLGVWSRGDALRAVTRGQLQHLVLTGEWQEPLPGAYCDGGYELSPEQRAWAAVLATGEQTPQAAERPNSRSHAVACGRTAARVHGLPLIDDDDPSTGARDTLADDVHTFRARGGRSRVVTAGEHTLVRRRLTLLPGDLVRHSSGLLLTSALRTACDCARLLTHEAAVCVLDAGLRRGLFTSEELGVAVQSREGWPGVRRLARAVHDADGRAESPAETLARLLLRPVLPALEPQVRVRDSRGRIVARLDLGDEQARFGVETDGKRGHAGTAMVAKDRRRDRRTGDCGWYVERLTWHELRTEQAAVRARVVALHAQHRERSF